MLHYYEKDMPLSFSESLRWALGKINRLFSLYIVMSLAALPLLVHRYIGYPHFGWKVGIRIIINLLLIQAWFPWESVKYSLNNLSWFLSCLLFLYCIFPIVHQIIKKLANSKRLLRAIVVTWIGMWLYGWIAGRFFNRWLFWYNVF